MQKVLLKLKTNQFLFQQLVHRDFTKKFTRGKIIAFYITSEGERRMSIALKAENVSIRYITGDFKDIGIKEYVVRKLTNNYHVNEFMAVDGVSFELESGDMLGIIAAKNR